MLAAHGITFLPEDDGGTGATGMVASGQTLTLTEAGKLALNKFPLQNLSTSPTKMVGGVRTVQLKSANNPVTKPVKIVTINTSTASGPAVVQKIQSKPVVINAPYIMPQTQKVIRIQPAEGGQKKRIIKLTAEQFAAIKSGKTTPTTFPKIFVCKFVMIIVMSLRCRLATNLRRQFDILSHHPRFFDV